MLINLVLLVALALSVVMLTGLVVRGIEIFAAAGAMTSKTKGQFLGYATSLPEFVGTVGTAGYGLLGAGLWNVAASNVINVVLLVAACAYHGRLRACAQRKFADEISFAMIAFVIPLVLSRFTPLARSPWTAFGLFGFFLTYLLLDRKLNPDPPPSVQAASSRRRGEVPKRRAVILLVTGLLGIITAGYFLGQVAEEVVTGLGVPQWAVGWILGVITSLPEMTAFFAVFASAKVEMDDPNDDTDCQENLDSLCASNMSNLALIYPIGIAVFLLIGRA